MAKRRKTADNSGENTREGTKPADVFGTRYPLLSRFVRLDGIVEIGYWPGHRESFARLLVEENVLWESEDRFETMDDLFEVLEAAVQQESE